MQLAVSDRGAADQNKRSGDQCEEWKAKPLHEVLLPRFDAKKEPIWALAENAKVPPMGNYTEVRAE